MKRILVTDDDQTCRESIQWTLGREGYDVETAHDVDSALEALRVRSFDLIISDYNMPVKTGLDFLKELREKQSQIPFLMISASTDGATEASALDLGASGFLRKPVRKEQLLESFLRARSNLDRFLGRMVRSMPHGSS
jgi:two-component system chemotaxis response regulator CheY